MGKVGPFGKSRKVFQDIQNGPRGFLEHKKNFFWNKNAMKVQQRRPKMEERRALENLLAHFGCAENPSVHSKNEGVLQMN
jgi:hypothetical protein